MLVLLHLLEAADGSHTRDGVGRRADFPYIRHQAFGGYVAIIVMLTWTGRGYLKQVWLRMQRREVRAGRFR